MSSKETKENATLKIYNYDQLQRIAAAMEMTMDFLKSRDRWGQDELNITRILESDECDDPICQTKMEFLELLRKDVERLADWYHTDWWPHEEHMWACSLFLRDTRDFESRGKKT